jgi:TolB-like protein
MPDVFLSYKRDDEAAASKLVTALRSAGLDVWWDRDIPASAPWEQTIEQALHRAATVVVCWSPASVGSENVRSEARWARARNKLIQAFLRPCDPPLFFGERQGVDLSRWSGHPSDPDIQQLVSTVRGALDGGGPARRDASAGDAPQPARANTRRSVAVLPFANLTGDPGKDYLGDGMAEELICTLSRGSDLRVPARTSAFAYKGRDMDVRQIGRDLGVEAVLEGSVRAAGERIRVTAQLIDASNGFHLWSQNFDRRFDDLFELQDEIAAAIAERLRAHLEPVSRSTEDLEAYDLYLQAVELSERSDVASVTAAMELLRQVIARDSGFARAHVRIARCLGSLNLFNAAPLDWHEQAVTHLRRAIALDPLLPEAHVNLASEHLRHRRWTDARESLAVALALDEADSDAHFVKSGMLLTLGYQQAALREALRTVELAPRAGIPAQLLGLLALHNGDVETGSRQLARLAELGSESVNVLAILAFAVAVAEGRWLDAAPLIARTMPEPFRRIGSDAVASEIAEAIAGIRPRGSAIDALDRLLASPEIEDWPTRFPATGAMFIYLYAQLGSCDRAFVVADKMVLLAERGGVFDMNTIITMWRPDMGELREDPRFGELAKRLGIFAYWERNGAPDGYRIEGGRLVAG